MSTESDNLKKTFNNSFIEFTITILYNEKGLAVFAIQTASPLF